MTNKVLALVGDVEEITQPLPGMLSLKSSFVYRPEVLVQPSQGFPDHLVYGRDVVGVV